jgi:hypothetical protein
MELATNSLSLFITNQINRNLVHLKLYPFLCIHITHSSWSSKSRYRQTIVNKNFLQLLLAVVRPRAQILIIPPASFADPFTYVHEVAFEIIYDYLSVPPDLTTATLYKYMVLHLLFPLHSWHCYIQTESNTAR